MLCLVQPDCVPDNGAVSPCPRMVSTMKLNQKLCLLSFLFAPAALYAQPATDLQSRLTALEAATKSAQSAGDNAWMLTSAALVLMMTGPGLALFYGGLVRRKNVLATMMQSFILMEIGRAHV